MEAVLKEFGWFDPAAADCGLELMEMPEFFEGFKFMVAFTSCAFPRAHSTSLQSAATLAENRYLHGAVLIFGTSEPLALVQHFSRPICRWPIRGLRHRVRRFSLDVT